jgi:hypothetical protein
MREQKLRYWNQNKDSEPMKKLLVGRYRCAAYMNASIIIRNNIKIL